MFTVHFEMKRDWLSLFGEYQYVSFKDTIAELGATYWVFGTERTDWEILGGARMSATLSEKWTFIGRADYGIGYDYDNGKTLSFDRYVYDATQQGPLLGLNIHW
jgi:hypothetical protein